MLLYMYVVKRHYKFNDHIAQPVGRWDSLKTWLRNNDTKTKAQSTWLYSTVGTILPHVTIEPAGGPHLIVCLDNDAGDSELAGSIIAWK